MTSKQRLIAALDRKVPDRLPVTTHHLMESFLRNTMGGLSEDEFFTTFGLDPIRWVVAHRPDGARGEFFDPDQAEVGFLEARRVQSKDWWVVREEIPGKSLPTSRFRFVTPKGELTMTTQSNEHTSWVLEHLVKQPEDINLIGAYGTHPLCDVEAINKAAADYGQRGLVRPGPDPIPVQHVPLLPLRRRADDPHTHHPDPSLRDHPSDRTLRQPYGTRLSVHLYCNWDVFDETVFHDHS